MRRHDGTLEVESEVGRGTTVRFRLPVRTEETVIPILLAAEPMPAGLRVLVVDDEPRVRDMVGEFLRREGSTVVTAANGSEALEKYRQNEFDLVITDRGMPEMNGDALAAAIKEESPDMPIIMLTGFGEMMISAGEKPQGVDCLLGKPVTPAAMRQAVATVRAEYARKSEDARSWNLRSALSPSFSRYIPLCMPISSACPCWALLTRPKSPAGHH